MQKCIFFLISVFSCFHLHQLSGLEPYTIIFNDSTKDAYALEGKKTEFTQRVSTHIITTNLQKCAQIDTDRKTFEMGIRLYADYKHDLNSLKHFTDSCEAMPFGVNYATQDFKKLQSFLHDKKHADIDIFTLFIDNIIKLRARKFPNDIA